MQPATVRGRPDSVMLGGCGTGRSSLLLRLRDLLGECRAARRRRTDCDDAGALPRRAPRIVAVPLHAAATVGGDDHGPRESFTAAPPSQPGAGTTGGPVTFLLDEFLELRTFESFPGPALGAARSDYRARRQPEPLRADHALHRAAHRLLRDAPARFEILPVTR